MAKSQIAVLSVALLALAGCADTPKPPAGYWISKPTGNDMAANYPDKAQARNIGGEATMRCKLTTTGLLVGCEIVEENPKGLGYGEATLRLVPKFRRSPTAPDGKGGEGTSVDIPVKWTLH